MLAERGVFYDNIEIMNSIIPLIDAEMAKKGESRITWDRPSHEYPNALYAVLFLTHIKRHVRVWAETNAPEAFWLHAFADQSEPF